MIKIHDLIGGLGPADRNLKYCKLICKPQINGVTLEGDKSADDLKLSYNQIRQGRCSTPASTAAKTVSLIGTALGDSTAPTEKQVYAVTFIYGNTAASATMGILIDGAVITFPVCIPKGDGSYDTSADALNIAPGETVLFTFLGDKWLAGVFGNATAARFGSIEDTLATKAPLASPSFTGTPTAPTPTAGDSSTKIATTEYVQNALPTIDSELNSLSSNPVRNSAVSLALNAKANRSYVDLNKAPIDSPAFTGTPTAPSPSFGDDSTKIATTAFVQDAVDATGEMTRIKAYLYERVQDVAANNIGVTDYSEALPAGVYLISVDANVIEMGTGELAVYYGDSDNHFLIQGNLLCRIPDMESGGFTGLIALDGDLSGTFCVSNESDDAATVDLKIYIYRVGDLAE